MADSDPTSKGIILTKGQQEFLESGYSVGGGDSNERVKRSRIRKRIQNALIEFIFIWERLEPEDREAIFKPKEGSPDWLYHGIRSLLQFIYLGCRDVVDFEALLQMALYDAEKLEHRSSGTRVDVDVSIETHEHYDLDEAEQKLRQNESLTFEEIGALLSSGELDESDLSLLAEKAQQLGYSSHYNTETIEWQERFTDSFPD